MTILRTLALTVVMTGATLAPALAHVTVTPKTAAPGSTPLLTFRCPDERATANTIELAIQLPPETPFATLRVPAVAGWRSRVSVRADGTADVVTWEGGTIAPHRAQTFEIIAGPMPASGRTLVFRAVQTYDNGEVVRWIEDRAPGEAEPPFPAPVLTIP
jgi:uncharacterized protein YcnI